MTNSITRPGSIFFAAISLFLFAGDLPASEPLLLDTRFAGGYEVMSPLRDIYTDRANSEAIHQLQPSKTKPVWRLVQWGSHKTLAKVAPEVIPDGGTRWAVMEHINNHPVLYKSVTLDLIPYPAAVGNNSPTITLELNGLAESGKKYIASSDEYWPHLLMAQNITTEKLAKYSSVDFSVDARLLFDEKNISKGYNKDLHAARFVVSFLVRNTLTGKTFWLNLPLYDDRFASSGFGCQKCREDGSCYTPQTLKDVGRWSCPYDGERWGKSSKKRATHRMLFRLPSAAMTTDNIQDGQWAHYSVDLIPYIKAGIQAVQDEEKLRGASPSLMFYNLSLFTMGWEITGLNHAAIAVKNLSLMAH